MKKFLTNGLGLFAILLIVNLVLFKVIHQVYLEEYEKVETTFSTYILSDSHGVPLKQLQGQSKVYNFSAASDSYIDMERKLKFLISNTKVERILITVDDHTLSPYREQGNNSDRSVFYLGLNNYSNYYHFIVDKYIKYYVVFLNPKYQSLIKPYLLNLVSSDTKGTGGKSWSELSEEEQNKLSLERFNDQFKESYTSEVLKNSLENIISLCYKNNIELIGIKYPISESYSQLMGDKTYNAEGVFLENNLRVLDCKKVFLRKNNFFENQDHLNLEGGIVFFQYLIKEIESCDLLF